MFESGHESEKTQKALTTTIKQLIKELKTVAQAFDNLTASITRLNASADKAIAIITTPPTGGATEAQTQASADAVNAVSDKLDKATTPPGP
jgi:hypothetical protein